MTSRRTRRCCSGRSSAGPSPPPCSSRRASVSTVLFVTGFSLRLSQIQRVFALFELLRGVAVFIAAPLLLHVSMTVASTPAGREHHRDLDVRRIGAGGGLVALSLFWLGRARLQRPALERWEPDVGVLACVAKTVRCCSPESERSKMGRPRCRPRVPLRASLDEFSRTPSGWRSRLCAIRRSPAFRSSESNTVRCPSSPNLGFLQ